MTLFLFLYIILVAWITACGILEGLYQRHKARRRARRVRVREMKPVRPINFDILNEERPAYLDKEKAPSRLAGHDEGANTNNHPDYTTKGA